MGISKLKWYHVWWIWIGLNRHGHGYNGYEQAQGTSGTMDTNRPELAWMWVRQVQAGPSHTLHDGYRQAWIGMDVGTMGMSRPKEHWVWWIQAGLSRPWMWVGWVQAGLKNTEYDEYNRYKQAQGILSTMDTSQKDDGCYDRYFFSNGLSTFSWVHLILSRHVIILSQGTLSFIYFLMRSLSPLCYHSLPLISVLCMAMPSFLLFHSDASRITHVMLPFYAQPI